MPSACEADEGGFRNSKIPPAGRPVSGPYEKKGRLWCLPVGAAISRPSLLPSREKVARKGSDEGDFWARIIYGGRPKGLPYPIPEGFLENRRGGARPSRGPASVRLLRKRRTASASAVGAAISRPPWRFPPS